MTAPALPSSGDWRWLTAAELATLRLPGWPATKPRVIDKISREGWDAPEWEWHPATNPTGIWRRRAGKGGGREYHYRLMPSRRQIAWQALHQPVPEDPTRDREAMKRAIARDAAWSFYERATDAKKAAATRKLTILLRVEESVRNGLGKDDAAAMAGREHGVGRSTIFGWYERIAGINREDWLPHLVDHRAGRQRGADTMPEEAWTLYKSLYLDPMQRTYAECFNRVRDAAEANGWKLPSAKTFARRIEQDVEHRVQVLLREGEEAHDRLFPAQRRDRSGFHALEAVNYDGHKLDLFTLWPGAKKPGRTFLIGFQDLYSGMIVGWRLDQSESAYGFRLAFGDVIENWGIPDLVWSDNTMAAAAKENTGGSRFRHRFKVKDDDPVGLFALVGSEIRFTKPRHGQSKPIERVFGTLSRYICKSPECAGAWTGNNVLNKPADYGSAAVPLEVLIKVVEREIHRFNHDPALNSVGGGKSRHQVFVESYQASPVRTAAGVAPELRRHWLLATEPVTCRKPDGSVWLHENRYWHEKLAGMIGAKVVLRFDPDKLHQPVHVYRLDGSYVCSATCMDDVGFADAEAAKRQARAVATFKRASKEMAASENLLGMDRVAAMMPDIDVPPTPTPKVVRPLFAGNLAVANLAVVGPAPEEEGETDRQLRTMDTFRRGMAALRVVTGDE